MITTNLTLTNGPTSDVPMEVVGVTFEVDTKLTINPAVTFPFTVAIDSSEVVGIDFDETLYTGDHTESITINTRNPRYNIVHTVSVVDISAPAVDFTVVPNPLEFDYDSRVIDFTVEPNQLNFNYDSRITI